mmetsp:Transcript_47023/g.112002  ORF Transcript_47023/g.112002 Transcript_47023/m.112002 type:complete len:209 (+) Transcript_47023:2-628(+)
MNVRAASCRCPCRFCHTHTTPHASGTPPPLLRTLPRTPSGEAPAAAARPSFLHLRAPGCPAFSAAHFHAPEAGGPVSPDRRALRPGCHRCKRHQISGARQSLHASPPPHRGVPQAPGGEVHLRGGADTLSPPERRVGCHGGALQGDERMQGTGAALQHPRAPALRPRPPPPPHPHHMQGTTGRGVDFHGAAIQREKFSVAEGPSGKED